MVSLNWRACSRWICFRRRNTSSAWRICARDKTCQAARNGFDSINPMADNRIDPRKNFVPRFLPWLLAAAALVFYWSTLNPWVSLLNIIPVAKISGWTWQPEVLSPVLFAITYPFRWLHTAQIPLALNFFSAVCAALAMGLLA